MILLLPILTGGVLLYLYKTGRLKRVIFFCFLAGTLAASASLLLDQAGGTRQEITGLPAGGSLLQGPVPLIVRTEDGQEEQVEIRVPEQKLPSAEARRLLEEKASELDTVIRGKNESLQHVEWNLELPDSFEDPPVSLIWSSDRPDVLNWNGIIGTAAEKTGSEVTLRANLTLEDEVLEFSRKLTVFPSKETSAWKQRLQEKGNAENEAQPGDTYRLPTELDGKTLTWYQESGGAGQKLCLLILAAAAMAALSAGQKKEEARKKRQQELLRRYPELLSKTHLLLAAGLSLRKVFERLASDYRREKKRTRKERPDGEEILRTWYEMENGVLEQDAFAHFGERCGIPEYKSFALLLAQNQKKGGYRLPQILEKEVQDAFETRKRQARIAGEKAAIRLALPMGMMLVVVLVIIMVPALLSF